MSHMSLSFSAFLINGYRMAGEVKCPDCPVHFYLKHSPTKKRDLIPFISFTSNVLKHSLAPLD